MVFLKFVTLVACVMFNISFAKGNTSIVYKKLREQAATCEKGETYEVEAGGCRNSCECVVPGIMKCEDNECETNEDTEKKEEEEESRSIFDKLRDDATNCEKGQEIDTEKCGKCTCVVTGFLTCQFKARCLPTNRRQEVSNVIIA